MPNEILTRAIDEVASGIHLTADHASAVLDEVMEGRASDVQAAAFLIALRAKGETVAELVGLARTMRRLAASVETPAEGLVDTAGTGGGPSTFNISTTAALVAAGAGCAVAKHGNRSNTSRCGSADVLEALGVRIDLDPGAIARCIEELGFGFMFAPRHHAAMKHVVPVRRELAVRTIFNFLGPLTNPAGASRQLLGVSDRLYQETIAEALLGLGCERALVVCADDGLDEVSVGARTRVIEVADGRHRGVVRDPRGPRDSPRRAAGSPAAARRTTRRPSRSVLAGDPGPARDVVALNAAAAILAAGGAHDLGSALDRARAAIDSGAPRASSAVSSSSRGARSICIPASAARLPCCGDEQARRARGGGARRRGAPQAAGSARRPPRRGGDAERVAPVQRGDGAARAVADRRVQAALAERRRDRLRGRPSRRLRRLRARRRRGALGAHRRAPLRRFARRSAHRPRGLDLPILRKDFIVDPYQLYEAAVNGADAVLLIVAALDDAALRTLYEEARQLDLDCLVEVHDEADLDRALELGADVIGINNRNLADLTVDLETTAELLTDVPAGKTVVSESGYDRWEQL